MNDCDYSTDAERFIVTNREAPIDFDWGQGAPDPRLPTNFFSVRWSGTLSNPTDGTITFFVAADAGAGVRLVVDSTTVLDTWENSPTNAVELVASNYFAAGERPIRLDYKETTGEARIRLSWIEPGTTNKVVIPAERLRGPINVGPTGVAVDAAGCIWATCFHANRAVRINPTAGPLVVADGLTNHVGEVDLEVDLGDGSYHQEPYTNAATPYNYSDMTGFNNRIVNPTGQPFKGYWTVIEDSGMENQVWERVSWTAVLPSGSGVEVHVRAHNERAALANEPFVAVTNGVPFRDVWGRYLEVRLALWRETAAQQPAVHDLTLWSTSSGFDPDIGLDYWWGYYETEDAWYVVVGESAPPVTYQWWARYPWEAEWTELAGETNAMLVLPNVDAWDDGTEVGVWVRNGAGQEVWLGPAELYVLPLPIELPDRRYGTSGKASRYPATIEVFGMRTNLASVQVVLYYLSHTRPDDLDILLVSPWGKKIMLMSDAGGNTAVTNVTFIFDQSFYQQPPDEDPIWSSQTHYFRPANYGTPVEAQLPGAPAGPYSTDLFELVGDDPNGVWRLYIYDDSAGETGVLLGSWRLEFTFQ